MKKQFVIVGALVCALSNISVTAQQNEKLEEVVVTATKFETSKKNIGKIVHQITAETIENNQGKTIVDFLNDIPGVEINGNYSTRGQNLGYYIRGGRNRQVAILIDGINVSDPSSFNSDFDLRQIDINQVERIEVMKGASSSLYGTGAATGVINIILKKASKEAFKGSFTTSVGSNRASQDTQFSGDEFTANFNFNGQVDKVDYLLSLNSTSSDGLSASENADKSTLNESDKFFRQNVMLKLGYNHTSNLRFGAFANFDEVVTEYDGFIYDPVTFASTSVDRDNRFNSIQKRAGFTTDFKYNKGELKVRTSFLDIRRNNSSTGDSYKGEIFGFDVFNNYQVNEEVSFIVGVASQYQDMFQNTSYSMIPEGEGKQNFIDPYLAINYASAYNFNLNVGGRMNIHSEYGNNFVFNVNPSYNVNLDEKNYVKFFASYSTAFVAPTLSEIFTKSPDLEALAPEKDITIEGGFELNVLDNVTLNATYFYREETDKIAYGYDPVTFSSITMNDFGTFLARGIETEVSYQALKNLQVRANYGFIDRDESLLLKIPQHKFAAFIDYEPIKHTNTSLAYRYVSETSDFGGVDLDAYSVIDLFVNHSVLNDNVVFFGSITNILNEDFQEIAGLSTRGRNFNVGLKVKF